MSFGGGGGIHHVQGGNYKICPGGGGGIYHVLREVVGNDKSHVQEGRYKFCPGGGFVCVCEWYKSCPGGTTNHILGSVHTAVLRDVI